MQPKVDEIVILVKNNFDVLTVFHELEKLMQLYLACPMTSVTPERCFSVVKTYLRSTTCENRLSGLTLMTIENFECDKVITFLALDILDKQIINHHFLFLRVYSKCFIQFYALEKSHF